MRHILVMTMCVAGPAGLTGCGTNGIAIIGYTVTIKTAPPATAVVGASIPVAFMVTENENDGTSRPAVGRSFGVTVTSGGGTINGSTTTMLTTTDDGSVAVTWVLGPTVGAQTVRGSLTANTYLEVAVTATAAVAGARTVSPFR